MLDMILKITNLILQLHLPEDSGLSIIKPHLPFISRQLFGLSSVEELDLAIRSCQALIFEAPEHSERRKNLVHKLVQLRLKKQEALVSAALAIHKNAV